MHIIGYILIFSLGILAGALISFDWQKLSAVGSILSGLGSCLASGAALFLGLYYNREKLEISVSKHKNDKGIMLQIRNKTWNIVYPQYVRAVSAHEHVVIVDPKDSTTWEKFEAFETKEPLAISYEQVQSLFVDGDEKAVSIEIQTSSGKTFRQELSRALFDK